MLASNELRRLMAQERIPARREVEQARLAELARRGEGRRRLRPSLRRSVGRSMISIGRRLAAEGAPAPVRSR